MFRGNHPATVDPKGRLKLPAAFLGPLLAEHGSRMFVTSLLGDSVWLYPLETWKEIENRLEGRSDLDRAKRQFLLRANYFGQEAELDRQGRVVFPQQLRECAGTTGRVDVIGKGRYIEAWDQARLVAKLDEDQFTDEDWKRLADAGI